VRELVSEWAMEGRSSNLLSCFGQKDVYIFQRTKK